MLTKLDTESATEKATCGLVMPIAAHDGCGADHWLEVKEIIIDAVKSIKIPEFSIKLVSDGDEIEVIHKRIVENLYSNDVVICDISGRNANVMFELGMRLAFDKATIIIKDDVTPFSFDTSPIEHVMYPRDLRFNKVVDFKRSLSQKLIKTYEASKNADFSQFLKTFNGLSPKKIETKEVPGQEFIFETLRSISSELERVRYDVRRRPAGINSSIRTFTSKIPREILSELNKEISSFIDFCKSDAGRFVAEIGHFSNHIFRTQQLYRHGIDINETIAFVSERSARYMADMKIAIDGEDAIEKVRPDPSDL